MKSSEIRKEFLEFFKSKDHKVISSSPLVLKNDPSLLFVNAGMNQFKDIFLGLKKPESLEVVTVQKCMRAGGKHNDLETVGESLSHSTFFEMLGNFSFGSYFKKEAIKLSFEFLTKNLKIDPDKLRVSVYEEDEEAYQIWKKEMNFSEERIYKLGKEDNFWQMGEVGPCGPCSEIYYYEGEKERPDVEDMMEIWNLVFMEFNKKENQTLKLPKPCVDTGMGLERLALVLQKRKSVYQTDILKEIILNLEKHSSKKYDFNEETSNDVQKAFRVLADHSRAIAFILSEGVLPGSSKESYVLRRIMRRAFYYTEKLSPNPLILLEGVRTVIKVMGKDYKALVDEEKNILNLIKIESELFSSSLKEGKKRLMEEMKSSSGSFVDKKTAWYLYSSYGFPIDLTRLIAKEKGWSMVSSQEMEAYKLEMSKEGKKNPKEKNKDQDFKKEAYDFIRQIYLKPNLLKPPNSQPMKREVQVIN